MTLRIIIHLKNVVKKYQDLGDTELITLNPKEEPNKILRTLLNIDDLSDDIDVFKEYDSQGNLYINLEKYLRFILKTLDNE